jgi:hypothetical protein
MEFNPFLLNDTDEWEERKMLMKNKYSFHSQGDHGKT